MEKTSQERLHILAVDDQPGNLIALEAVLSREYNLINANSGVEALTILKQRQDIAVILMDIQMPIMDGFDTATLAKKIEGYQDIPIIFITATYKEEPFVKRGYEVGGIDYFSKPFDPEILKLKVGIYASFGQKTALLKEREAEYNKLSVSFRQICMN